MIAYIYPTGVIETFTRKSPSKKNMSPFIDYRIQSLGKIGV